MPTLDHDEVIRLRIGAFFKKWEDHRHYLAGMGEPTGLMKDMLRDMKKLLRIVQKSYPKRRTSDVHSNSNP